MKVGTILRGKDNETWFFLNALAGADIRAIEGNLYEMTKEIDEDICKLTGVFDFSRVPRLKSEIDITIPQEVAILFEWISEHFEVVETPDDN